MYTYCLRTFVFCVLLTSSPLYSQSQQELLPEEIEVLIQQLINQQKENPFLSCRIHGILFEESWPSYEYSDHEINQHISDTIKDLQASPPVHLRDTDLIRDHFEAIPYNIRYAYRASERQEYSFAINTEGDRYYWNIVLNNFIDLTDLKNDMIIPYYLTPEDESYFNTNKPAPHATTRFNPLWNQKRIFAWDGHEHIFYNTSSDQRINHAWRKAQTTKPDTILTPLQSGIIPWGHGFYSLERLQKSHIVAQNTLIQGIPILQFVLQNSIGSHTTEIHLQKKKTPKGTSQYALLSQKLYQGLQLIKDMTCDKHVWHAEQWIPTSVITTCSRSMHDVPRTERTTLIYNFTDEKVSPPMFRPQLKGALVTYDAPGLARSLTYQMSPLLDHESLLAERLSIALQPTSISHAMVYQIPKKENCATVALDYCTRKLGHPIPKDQLQTIVGDNGLTRLSDMVTLIQKQNLYCQAVQTDLTTLAARTPSEAILYLPNNNHFIVLAAIDTYNVWCLDLTKDNFLYKVEKNAFTNNVWLDGTALILTNNSSIISDSDFTETIYKPSQEEIVGGIGFTCTKLLQDESETPCQSPSPCQGTHQKYIRLLGCELAESGSCSNHYTAARRDSDCITDPNNPVNCKEDKKWRTIYYLNACGN